MDAKLDTLACSRRLEKSGMPGPQVGAVVEIVNDAMTDLVTKEYLTIEGENKADALCYGCRFRTLNVLEEGVREALDIVIDTSVPGGRVVRTLGRLVAWRGRPKAIRVDNGPEYLSQVFRDWCRENDVALHYIQPGKPNQNAYIERFNRTYRHDVLDAYLFESLDQVCEITRRWIREYNEERPHDSLGRIPPAVFQRHVENAGNSSFEMSH